MKISYTKCDVCGEKNPKYENIKLPVITYCDWTEGRPQRARIEFICMDICEKCLMKATHIEAGFQGHNLTICTIND